MHPDRSAFVSCKSPNAPADVGLFFARLHTFSDHCDAVGQARMMRYAGDQELGHWRQRPVFKEAHGVAKRYGYHLATLIVMVASLCITGYSFTLKPTDSQCTRRNYSWSPALEIIKYRWETFEHHDFFHRSPFFGVAPTPEIETLWKDLLPENPIAIPNSYLQHLNQSQDVRWARSPQNDDTVLGLPEVFVQLTCLHFLWQFSYRDEHDFSHLPAFHGSETALKSRADQCFERLRQAVMCWADPGVNLKWLDDDPKHGLRAVFDMGTLHKCRNFEDVRDWTKQNGVSDVVMRNAWWGGASVSL